MPVSHGFYDHEDDDGFHFATCICGWQGPPVPDIEDAADTYGDHRAVAALAARPQADAHLRVIVTDLACTNSGHRTAVETLIERAREALAPALTESATPTTTDKS